MQDGGGIKDKIIQDPVKSQEKPYIHETPTFENGYTTAQIAQMTYQPGSAVKLSYSDKELAMLGRNGALNEAKRDAGIPITQQPQKVVSVAMRTAEYEGGHVIKDDNGRIIYTREYYYTSYTGEKIVIQDHSAGHKKGGQRAHFNVRKAGDT